MSHLIKTMKEKHLVTDTEEDIQAHLIGTLRWRNAVFFPIDDYFFLKNLSYYYSTYITVGYNTKFVMNNQKSDFFCH